VSAVFAPPFSGEEGRFSSAEDGLRPRFFCGAFILLAGHVG